MSKSKSGIPTNQDASELVEQTQKQEERFESFDDWIKSTPIVEETLPEILPETLPETLPELLPEIHSETPPSLSAQSFSLDLEPVQGIDPVVEPALDLTLEPAISLSAETPLSQNNTLNRLDPLQPILEQPLLEQPLLDEPLIEAPVHSFEDAPKPAPKADLKIEDTRVSSSNPNFGSSVATLDEELPLFDLAAEGTLSSLDQSKLGELLESEKMGFSSEEIAEIISRPNFVIRYIPESLGIHIVRKFRTSSVRWKLQLNKESVSTSDRTAKIMRSFSESDSFPGSSPSGWSPKLNKPIVFLTETDRQRFLVSQNKIETIDVLSTSGVFFSPTWQVEQSSNYETLFERLKEELKIRCLRKGGNALNDLQVEVIPRNEPNQYVLKLTASAVRVESDSENSTFSLI